MEADHTPGYSIDEAAHLLGVPPGRVWELLARGALAGEPFGDGYRVFLQPPPAPHDAWSRQAEPVHAGGSATGRSAVGVGSAPSATGADATPPFEITAFRELLTEFRNLTERYGQALLALGEARGEVAQLRHRVELLEARVDLRLPAAAAPDPAGATGDAAVPAPEAPAAWNAEAPEAATTRPQDDATAPRAAAYGGRAPASGEQRRRKPRARKARPDGTGIAAALERAQDPTPPLPGAEEAAAALAALRGEVGAAEPGELSEPVSADHVPVEEEWRGPEPGAEQVAMPAAGSVDAEGATPEPDWIADEDIYSFASLSSATARAPASSGGAGDAAAPVAREAAAQVRGSAIGVTRARSAEDASPPEGSETRATALGIEVGERIDSELAWQREAEPPPELELLELPGRHELDAALAALEAIAVSPELTSSGASNGHLTRDVMTEPVTSGEPGGDAFRPVDAGPPAAANVAAFEPQSTETEAGQPARVDGERAARPVTSADPPAADWLRGRRGAAARAYRRIRRLFSR